MARGAEEGGEPKITRGTRLHKPTNNATATGFARVCLQHQDVVDELRFKNGKLVAPHTVTPLLHVLGCYLHTTHGQFHLKQISPRAGQGGKRKSEKVPVLGGTWWPATGVGGLLVVSGSCCVDCSWD